jgi:lysyl-tRNA synthetase, class II
MKLKIAKEIFSKYPETNIGYVIANIEVKKSDPNVDVLKNNLSINLKNFGITNNNYSKHPNIINWRKVFKDFEVSSDYRCSAEALVRRIVTNNKMWNISSIVDLYNCCSVLSMIPMGGYDLEHIKGDIVVRYGLLTDNFDPLSQKEQINIDPKHIIYADDEKVICWLWNYKDSKISAINNNTKQAIFFLDSAFALKHISMEQAIAAFETNLVKLGAVILDDGVLNINNQETKITLKNLLPKAIKTVNYIDIVSKLSETDPLEHHFVENVVDNERLAKLEKLKLEGYAWPNNFKREHLAENLHDNYDNFTNEQLIEKNIIVTVAGRIMLKRVMGKASFVTLQDMSSKIQIYLQQEILNNLYEQFKTWDLGDIIGVHGVLFKTKTGELSVKATSIILLTKSLRSLPEKWHGLQDQETRYRQRYLDLIVNPNSRKIFQIRSKIVHFIREYLNNLDFLEVETPMMQIIPGGAVARPFVTYHNALGMDLYLRVAPELYLKRLVVGGFEKVYEINRNFRNEGLSTRHNPEFTMLEFYQAFADYQDLMNLTEDLFKYLANKILGSNILTYQNQQYDFSKPFNRLTFKQAILKYNKGLSSQDLEDRNKLLAYITHKDIAIDHNLALGKIQFELYEKTVEHNLLEPTFITEHPTDVSPLARRNDINPEVTDRFELYIAGREIANAFSELNDPIDQKERFKSQASLKDGGDVEAMHYDQDYICALEYGMPPTAGEGIGIDRLVMLFTDQSSIRDVLLFPHMRSIV